MNMYDYFIKPQKNDYFKTSDLGEIKDDFLYLKGRIDTIIKYKGEKINLDYIKNILMKHDLIISVEVFIDTNENHDDIIVSKVLAKDKTLSVENLKEWCKIKIGKYKTPKKIIISYM